MKLINPTDDQLNACFAENVAGWRLLPRIFHNGQWRDVPTWVDGKFYDGKAIDYCAPGQWLGAHYPAYTKSADAVLPWLEKWPFRFEAGKALGCQYGFVICGTGGFVKWGVGGWHRAIEPTFSRAAVIALIRAHGIEVEFSA